MQIDLMDILYTILFFGILITLVKLINKRSLLKHRMCSDFSKQKLNPLILENKIEEKIVQELYEIIEKHFGIKKCYLNPDDKIKIFYDLNSFDLHEDFEDFITYLHKKFFIETIELQDTLIDIMLKMQNSVRKPKT